MLAEPRAPPPCAPSLQQQLTASTCYRNCWVSPLLPTWLAKPRYDTRRRRQIAGAAPRMVIVNKAANASPDELRDRGIIALSWWPPWQIYGARRSETQDLLTGANGYDAHDMERFFDVRPERVWTRCAQVAVEVVGVLLAFAGDQLSAAGGGDERAPEHIRQAVTRLGPNFVKIGQALASRPDLVGESIAGQLLLLQDALPTFSNDMAREFIREELGGYPEDAFDNMGSAPVAAASLGQVYKAWIGGRPVAVKVQRPDLLEAVGLDFYLARCVADTIARLSRDSLLFEGRLAVRSDLVAAVDEYGSRLFEELDYRIEASNMVLFRELYGSMPGVVVPGVLLDHSARRVITTEWVEGVKLVDAYAQVSPADMPILRVGIDCTLTQLLDKGFLHADPHSGNLLKTPDNRLAYLDFGLVSTIPPTVMDALICATVQVMNRDYVSLAKGFPALALMSEDDLVEDFAPFAVALEAALDPIVTNFRRQLGLDGGGGDEMRRIAFAQLIDRIFLLARSFNFKIPPYFISNVRALGELEGLAMTADAGFSLISVVYPYVCRRLLSDPSPSLRAALEDLALAPDGSVRWDVLEALVKDSNTLDQRYGPDASRPPLDISLEFFLSSEGAFLRNAAASDLRKAAYSAFSRKIPTFGGRFRKRHTRKSEPPSSSRSTPPDVRSLSFSHIDGSVENATVATATGMSAAVAVAESMPKMTETGTPSSRSRGSSRSSSRTDALGLPCRDEVSRQENIAKSKTQGELGCEDGDEHVVAGDGEIDEHESAELLRKVEEAEGREASRRELSRRLISGARRRPALVLRVCMMVTAAAVRAAGTATVRGFRGAVIRPFRRLIPRSDDATA